MPTYTAPTTRASGFLVTASVWNTDIVENIKYLKDAPTFDGAVTASSTLTAANNVGLAATKKLYLDGVAMSGDTYISESSANVLSLFSGNVEAKLTSGVLTVSGGGAHSFAAAFTGGQLVSAQNTAAGAANYAAVNAISDTVTTALRSFSSTYTTSGVNIQSSTLLLGDGSGGLSVAAIHASGPIRFYSGGTTEVGRWHTDGDLYSVAVTDYAGSSTISGWSSFTSGRKYINYKKIGKLVFVNFHLEGTSNSTIVSFTLPYASRSQYGSFGSSLTLTYDNGAYKTTAGRIDLNSANGQVNVYSDGAAGTWTASGTKIVAGDFWYFTT